MSFSDVTPSPPAFVIVVIGVQDLPASWRLRKIGPLCFREIMHKPQVSWWLDHPFEKYVRQIGSSLEVGMKIKHIWNHHLTSWCEKHGGYNDELPQPVCIPPKPFPLSASVLGWKVMELLGSSLARSPSTPGTRIVGDHERQNNDLQGISM